MIKVKHLSDRLKLNLISEIYYLVSGELNRKVTSDGLSHILCVKCKQFKKSLLFALL